MSSSVLAQSLYITDEFKVTLRTGTSTSNNILTMLKSGQKVELLEHDAATKYSHVRTESGKDGYVLTRFLEKQPSNKQRLAALTVKHEQLKTQFNELKAQYDQLLQQDSQSQQTQAQLEQELSSLNEQYAQLQTATKDTQSILAKNSEQVGIIEQLQADKDSLAAENTSLKDNTAMNWFIRGAGVFLLAFLIGIIVTRIQWKKRQSWDEF